jgi:tRNA nucleotidyltransferase/poly(A) polymerase
VANYFKVGDPIFFGKYKNKQGKIVRFFKDGRGLPYVEVEPVPKGRKKNREIGLFNIWHQDTAKRASALAQRKQAEMSHAASVALMKWLSQVTQRMGVAQHVYVVGGAVRNFLIDQPIKDIDMVVDSQALRGNKDSEWVAQQIARRIPAQTEIVTDNLMVSKVLIKGDWDLDGYPMKGNDIEIVNAREEVYEQDEAGDYLGHKPLGVKPTSLEVDVTRREFTFNTLMWSLLSLANGPEKAEIIDLTGCGLRDLEKREMRCPQDPDLTFKQDPTRILRTIKFAFKYGFKLPPDVKAAAKRQAKGLKRIPSKTWSVLQKIVLDNAQYKKALSAMEDLGVTDVLAEMMQEDRPFASTMSNYSRNRGVAYMFDLMDVGIPGGAALNFLDGRQQKQLRKITAPMDRDEALEFLEAVKNPGRAYKDKKFVPQLAMSKGYTGKGMAVFMPQVIELGRELLLESPELVSNPNALKREVARAVEGLPAKVARVVAKFKNKREVPRADGKGTSTIYEYGPRQVQNRNKAKAQRVEKLRGTIGKLRKQVKSDLASDDSKTRLSALAVALIDQTYERVGNDKSASENGHYGITTLTVDHIKMGKGKATLSYVGKSGVEHTKTVTDKPTITALKAAMKGRGKKDRLLCDGADCTVRARDVNAYLRQFDITAKDLRGMHANEEMRKRMTQIRKKGPQLPRGRKERDKILKAEFKEALEGTAEAVGHKASTLKSQYLVPGMEDAFLKDGTVIDKLHKKAAIGQCYPWANQFALDKDGAEIVHGTIVGPDRQARIRPLDHAWVEWRGKVYDWQTVEAFKKPPMRISEWRKKNQAREHYRLSGEEALICSVRSGKKGPWTEAEREWVVSRRTAARPEQLPDGVRVLPHNRWESVSWGELSDYVRDTVWDVYDLTYGRIGKHVSNIEQFGSKYRYLYLIDVDDDIKADAFIAYKDTPAGYKIALGGTDGGSKAKKAMIQKMKDLIRKPGWYAEASNRVADILESAGARPIMDEETVRKVLRGKEITWLGDGKYGRQLGSSSMSAQKSLYGNPKVAAAKKYEHIDFVPPTTVANAAKKGLELREKASPSNRGGLTSEEAGKLGIGSGVQRAVNLKNRNSLTPATIKKMNGFFSRHEQNKNISPENKGKPWNDKGYVSWLLWGGDPGKSWATKILKQMEAADEKSKKKASLEDQWGAMAFEASRLKTQVFLLGMPQEGRAPMGGFDKNKLPKGRLKITNRPSPVLDKPKGAFWTSSLEGGSSGWIEWCSWEMPHWIGNQAVLFKPKGGAKVLWIRSPQDYQDVVDRYPFEGKFGDRGIDWESLSKDYDAVTCPGGRCIYGWDAESTAWFNMNALQFERVVDVKHKCTIPDDEDDWGPTKEYELKVGTKSDSEKEDEEAQRLVRNSPKNKPPRRDLERSLVKDHKDDDPDEKQDRKDRSLNFKDIAATMLVRRVAHRFRVAEAAVEEDSGSGGGVGGKYLEFLKEMGDKQMKNPDTGNQVKLKSLKGDKGKKLQQDEFQKWLSKNEDKGGKGKGNGKDKSEGGETTQLQDRANAAESQRQEEERSQQEAETIVNSLDYLNDALTSDITDSDLRDFTPEQMQAFSNSFGAASTKMDEGDNGFRTDPGKRKSLEKKVKGFRDLLNSSDSDGDKLKQDPKKFAEALATVDYYERVLNNPLVVPNNPISEKGGKLKGKDLEKAKAGVSTRAKETYSRYQGVDSDTRNSVLESLNSEIASLDEGSARRLELEGMVSGLGVLSAVEDGDDFEGGVAAQQIARGLASTGNIDLLMAVAPQTMGDALAHQQEIRSSLGSVEDEQWATVLGEDAPGSPIAELLGAGTKEGEDGQYLTEDDRAFLRELLSDEIMGEVAVVDPAVSAKAPKSGDGKALMEVRGIPEAAKKVQSQIKEALGSDEFEALMNPDTDTEEEKKGFWGSLMEILGLHRKETINTLQESNDSDERKNGDTWKSGDKWYGKKDGETKSFDTEDGAKGFAKGASTTPLARGYTFEVWDHVGVAGGQKSPFHHR